MSGRQTCQLDASLSISLAVNRGLNLRAIQMHREHAMYEMPNSDAAWTSSKAAWWTKGIVRWLGYAVLLHLAISTVLVMLRRLGLLR